MHSNLSRDELGYLLSVCEQRAKESYEPFKQLVEALGPAVAYCSEPGCSAMKCFRAYVNCTSLEECELMRSDSCANRSSWETYGWCDVHAKTGLWTVTKQCHRAPHHACTSYIQPTRVCKDCKAAVECDLEYTQDLHTPYIAHTGSYGFGTMFVLDGQPNACLNSGVCLRVESTLMLGMACTSCCICWHSLCTELTEHHICA